MFAMKFSISLYFLFFLATNLYWAKLPEELSVNLPLKKAPINPLTNFVKEVPFLKVISTGTYPHVTSLNFLKAEVEKNNFKIPVQFEWQSDINLSDTALIEPNIKTLRTLILQYFKLQNDSDADVEWIRAPFYDFHENELTFMVKVKLSDNSLRFYGKTIFLMQNGYLAFQILTPYHKKLPSYHKQWSEELKIKDAVDYRKSTNPRVRDMRDLLKRWTLPFGAKLEDLIEESEQTILDENTKRTAGITFLIFSILFFIFVSPKSKDQ